jgi:hypothetical protein
LFFKKKSIDVWHIVETGWTPPETAIAEWTIPQKKKKTRVVNEKAMNSICQALSPSEFSRISHCETAKEAWEVLETIYEGTQLVKTAKLQMLVAQFEGIRILEEETFNEFYTKISDFRNFMISLGKKNYDAKIIKKILLSLPIVTTIEESKDLDTMRIEELVGSLQNYDFSLPPLRKTKANALKVAKEKSNNSFDEDFDGEDGFALFARNFRTMMNSSKGKFRNKNTKSSKNPKGTNREKYEYGKKDPRCPRCLECSGYGHICADCGNLKQSKGKAFNATLSDDSDCDKIDETLGIN